MPTQAERKNKDTQVVNTEELAEKLRGEVLAKPVDQWEAGWNSALRWVLECLE